MAALIQVVSRPVGVLELPGVRGGPHEYRKAPGGGVWLTADLPQPIFTSLCLSPSFSK